MENNQTEITFSRVNFKQIDFPVPVREGFAFNGWYIGGTKITDENGKMLIGESILNKSSTITAKWTLVETLTYKILLVYVTEVQATLPTIDNSKPIDVNYTMSDIEREFCKATTKQLKRYMDGMMDGLVEFKIDEYYTEIPVLTENFEQIMTANGGSINDLFPTDIPEVGDMLDGYDSVLSVFSMNDFSYPHKLHDSGGAATARYAQVNFDAFIYSNSVYKVSLTDMLENLNHSRWTDWMEVFIHETAHTIECRILGNYLNTEYSYHNTGASYDLWIECKRDVILANKLYYLQAIEKNGIKVGIPYGFWKGDIATVKYLVSKDTYGSQGHIKTNNIGTANPVGSSNMCYEVVYENNITVTAVPITGYEFVGWSDGVTTATRTDFITGDFEVTAIFQPITYELTIVAGEGGTIKKGEGTHTLQYNGSSIVITAVAQDGYRFVGWSDGATNYSRPFWITHSNMNLFDENNSYTLTAIFEKIE